VSSPISTPRTPEQNVVRGGLLALLVIPVGVIIFSLLSSIGFVASITGFVIAFGAVWLYRKGAGGIVTRAGAWVVTAIVIVTLLISFYVSMVVEFATAVAKSGTDNGLTITAWDVFNKAQFWPTFNENFGEIFNSNALFFVLALAFGILGAFRTLRGAFLTSVPTRSTAATFGTAPTGTYTSPVEPTYRNDVDGAPTASADDKTPPPTSQY